MPGKRNFARERRHHAAHSAARLRELNDLLRSQLPDRDHVLVGWSAVLHYLHSLGVRRPNHGPITVRMVQRWVHVADFPLLRGNRHRRKAAACVSTHFACTAWVLSRLDSQDLFHVPIAVGSESQRSFSDSDTPRQHAA